MKKFYSLLFGFLLLTVFAKAQYVTIPDVNFKAYLQQQYPSCFNTSGMMDTTCSDILNATKLQVGGLAIFNLDGIQYFKSLSYLDCSQNADLNLPSLPSSLTYLDCSLTSLTSLPLLPNSLTYLDCSENSLNGYLPVLPASLTHFDCYENGFSGHLPALPSGLVYLDCSRNEFYGNFPTLPSPLTYLNCSENIGFDAISDSAGGFYGTFPSLPASLTYLDCDDNVFSGTFPALPNSLTYLDCSGNSSYGGGFTGTFPSLPNSLVYLACGGNLFSGSFPPLPNSLKYLECSENQSSKNGSAFTGFSTLSNSLTYFDCSEDQISSLPSLPSSLDTLICSANFSITSLPALPASLSYLDCSTNKLSIIPTPLPSSLNYLECQGNQITSIPALPNSLAYFDCSYNQLANLPALTDSITYLNCNSNKLVALPALPNSLLRLNCNNNQLTTLPTLPDSLVYLDCSLNQLSGLPSLTNSIDSLICSSNILNGIAALPNALTYFDCSNNNIYCLPKLPEAEHVLSIILDTSKINCLPNKINALLILLSNPTLPGGVTLPLCNPTNNINNCQEFPVMTGYAFYDNNSNGIKDPTELYMPYVKLQLSDGDYTFTNTNGYYAIAAIDGLGSYALFPYAPTYYKAVPVIMNYTFTSFDTLVTQNIAMQPTAIVDSLNLNTFSYHFVARPGSVFPVLVNYSDVGTTTLSPNITFTYDNTLLTYDSSSNPAVINNGNKLTLSVGSFTPGQSGSFVAYFSVNTNDVLGDSVRLNAAISANAASASDSILTIISSSFDPNYKTATPQLTPGEVAEGKAITYTIGFQNTGNDTAFNIVIADTLSSLLLDSTVQMISSSKPCKVTVTGNVIYFEFLNIQLPDSAVNSLGSNGYVSFSVKPLSSVSSGSISNSASVYFDYNAPVVTNTATTQIGNNTVVPLTLLSFNGLTQPGSTNTLLYWTTANELNTKSFVVEQSTDGINFTILGSVPAKGYGNNSYSYTVTDNAPVTYYRLKMIDLDGRYSYSRIITIEDAAGITGITVLPNPADNWITIKTVNTSLTNTNARIINSEGAVVKEFILSQSNQTIDVSSLPQGFYSIITLLGSKKIIISRQ